MRPWILPIAAVVGFAVGCNKSPEGGTSPNAPAGSNATFKVSLPTDVAAIHTIKQGTSESYDGSIDRGSDFKKDVKLKVDAPAKVDVKLSKDTIKASDGDTKFTLIVTPAKDAPIGDHVVKVTGTPESGSATTGEFKIKVTAP